MNPDTKQPASPPLPSKDGSVCCDCGGTGCDDCDWDGTEATRQRKESACVEGCGVNTPKQPASPTSPPAACSASVWIRGEPPLNKIVLIWNGKQIFGPISFHRDGDLALFLDQVSNYHGGYPTHYMIVPKCEDVETPNTQAEP